MYFSVFSLSASVAGSENLRTISSRAFQLFVLEDVVTGDIGESGYSNGARHTSAFDEVPMVCTMMMMGEDRVGRGRFYDSLPSVRYIFLGSLADSMVLVR